MSDPIPVFVRRAGDTNHARCAKSSASSTSDVAFAAEKAAAKALGCPVAEVLLQPAGSALFYALRSTELVAGYQSASEIVRAHAAAIGHQP